MTRFYVHVVIVIKNILKLHNFNELDCKYAILVIQKCVILSYTYLINKNAHRTAKDADFCLDLSDTFV